MSDQEVLRKALNEIDGLRYRMGWGFGITAAISQAAWIAVLIGSRQSSDRQLILLCAFAGAWSVHADAGDLQDDAQDPAGD